MNLHLIDLDEAPCAGLVEIHRRVALCLSDVSPKPRGARLIVRAAALQATALCGNAEVADALRALACEIEGGV